MATSTNTPSTSYTAMDTADLDAIGHHCEYTYCNQLDFLPFRCDSCHHTYCLDHRSESSHKCSHAGEWARNRRLKTIGHPSNNPSTKPTLATSTQCSEPKCKTFVNTPQNLGIHCPNCNRSYCLKHRFREDHDCANLIPLGARSTPLQNNAEKVKLGFSRLRSWGKDKQTTLSLAQLRPKPKPSSKSAQLAALNQLKKTAKGDPSVFAEKRVYLHVEAEASTTTSKLPKADLYFNSEWSVGRMLDDAAKRLQVANLNNKVETEQQRLRVYHVEGGRLLEFAEKLGQAVRSGDTIVLLRGVGPAEEKE